MHPGGGGDALSSEISSQEAAAMAVAAAAQHQCLQLSLNRGNPTGDPGSLCEIFLFHSKVRYLNCSSLSRLHIDNSKFTV